jgi:tetratricopeptide (TPR) repeat protein
MIRATCPICRSQACLPDTLAGKTYQCSTCGVRHRATGPVEAGDEVLTAIPVEEGGLLAGKGLMLTIAGGVGAGVLLALVLAVVLVATRGKDTTHEEHAAAPGPAERPAAPRRATPKAPAAPGARTPLEAGKQAFEAGRYGDALAQFDEALKAGGGAERAQLYAWRGQCHEKQGEDGPALEDYDKAIQEGDKTGLAYRRRAVLHARKNEYQAAEKDCSDAIADGQDPGQVRTELVSVYRESATSALRKDDAATAAACLHWAVIHAPDDGELRGLLGETNCKLKQWDAAIAELEKAVALGARDREKLLAGAYMSRGVDRLKKGEDERALADYRKAEQLDPAAVGPYKRAFGPLLKTTEEAKAGPRKKPEDVAAEDEEPDNGDDKSTKAAKPKKDDPDAEIKRPRTPADKAKQEREAAAKLSLAQQIADRAAAASNEGKNAQPLYDKARAWMKEVIRDYPGTKAAAEAAKALEKLD